MEGLQIIVTDTLASICAMADKNTKDGTQRTTKIEDYRSGKIPL